MPRPLEHLSAKQLLAFKTNGNEAIRFDVWTETTSRIRELQEVEEAMRGTLLLCDMGGRRLKKFKKRRLVG
jgi:hypothetical protein